MEPPKQHGARGIGTSGVPLENPTKPATLADIGITKKQSARAQKLAAIPAEEFAERVDAAKAF